MELNKDQLLAVLSKEANFFRVTADHAYPDDHEYNSSGEERHDLYLRTREDTLREVIWMIEHECYSFKEAAAALETDDLRWL